MSGAPQRFQQQPWPQDQGWWRECPRYQRRQQGEPWCQWQCRLWLRGQGQGQQSNNKSQTRTDSKRKISHLQESSKDFSNNFNILSFPTKIKNDTDVAINNCLDVPNSTMEENLNLSKNFESNIKRGLRIDVRIDLSSWSKRLHTKKTSEKNWRTYSNPGLGQKPW